MSFFRSVDAISNVWSSLEIFKEMGRVCSKVILFLSGTQETVRLGNQIVYKSCIDCKMHSQFSICTFTCSQRFEKKVIFCLYSTITQKHFYGYSDWYVIVNVAYNVLIIWPSSQDYFISTI